MTSQAKAGAFLEARGIPLDPRDEIRTLSASQRQLVMIARALYQDPRLLILDEPTSALTKEEAVRLFDLLRSLREQGLTTIFVSHRIDEVVELCDHVTVIRDGVAVADIAKADIAPRLIIRQMIGRELEELFPERPDRTTDDVALAVEELRVRNPFPAPTACRRWGLVPGAGRRDPRYRRPRRVGTVRAAARTVRRPARALGERRAPRRAPRHPLAEGGLRSGIGFLTEDRKKEGLLFNIGVRPNLTLADLGKYGNLLLRRRREVASTLEQLQQFDVVAASTESPIGTLSGGNQQKVLIARSLQRKPTVLLLG